MVKAKKYVLSKNFDGFPKEGDLQLVEEQLPPIKNGQFLVEAAYLSVDPYQFGYSVLLKPGDTFIGSQVAKIIETKNPRYPVGKYVVGEFGWRTHSIGSNDPDPRGFPKPWLVPDFEDLPLSLALGVLGATGNTAYFGLLEICKPQPGETVVVTGAAGGVGSIVGQVAKIKGCTVVGIAGSEEKGQWLVDDLHFDHFINYKDPDFDRKLEEATPNGVDCYFDNVGGVISGKILERMNDFGRVSICGIMAELMGEEAKVAAVQRTVVTKQLKMEGFTVFRWLDRWLEGIRQNKRWIKEGQLQYRETVTEGFDNLFKAFVDMLQGGNVGKAVVKV